MSRVGQIGVPSAFFLFFASFCFLWHPRFAGDLVSDADIWGFYHPVFYLAGILKPFLFWKFPSFTPFSEVTTYYEPLPQILFAALLQTFGGWRVPFYLWGFFLHATNAILIFFLSKELVHSRFSGVIAAGFFLLYPANVSVISDLSRSLEHPMVVLGGLLSLCSFTQFLKTRRRLWYAFSLLFFVLACFSKISALNFVAAVILLDLFLLGKGDFASRLDRCLPFVLGGLLFAAVATWLYPWGGIPHQWGGTAQGAFPFLRLVEFTAWLLFPFSFSGGEPLLLALAAFFIFWGLLVWGDGFMRFLTMWILAAFSLFAASNFRPVEELYKYMYISTVPFSMLVSYGILRGIQKFKAVTFV